MRAEFKCIYKSAFNAACSFKSHHNIMLHHQFMLIKCVFITNTTGGRTPTQGTWTLTIMDKQGGVELPLFLRTPVSKLAAHSLSSFRG